jgi:NAD(P)-dependent dehydrogenase (short-subunit alcohol dehydrogenase family)
MSTIRLDGKVAVVTGAGRGIGRAYALALAERGARVVVNDLGAQVDGNGADQEPADSVVEEIRARGGAAVASYDDVVLMNGGRKIIETALERFGTVDILIQNAGILRDRSFLKMSEEEWDQVIGVHLKGAFAVAQPTLRVMKQNNFGRIVFTSSSSGLFGAFGQTNYGAAKMGILGMMNSLCIEMAKHDIKINTVAPTAGTRMTENLFPKEILAKVKTKLNVPLVLYLVSDECPVSGMTFCAKGGWYGRAAVVCGKGMLFDHPEEDITAEEIRDRFDQITDLDGASPLGSSADTFAFMKK